MARLLGEPMPATHTATDPADLYLDLLKTVLTRSGMPPRYRTYAPHSKVKRRLVRDVNLVLGRFRGGLALVRVTTPGEHEQWAVGHQWHPEAETMVSLA